MNLKMTTWALDCSIKHFGNIINNNNGHREVNCQDLHFNILQEPRKAFLVKIVNTRPGNQWRFIVFIMHCSVPMNNCKLEQI